MLQICPRCGEATDDLTDDICEDCWDWAVKYLEDTEENF